MAPKRRRKLSPYNKFVQKHMLAGLSMSDTAKLWQKAGKKAKASPKRVARKAPKKKVKRKMAKKRTYRRKNGFSQAKMFSLIRKLSLIAPGLGVALGGGTPKDKVARGILAYTGYNTAVQRYELEPLKNTYTPFLATTVLTAVIPKMASFVKGVF